MTCIKKIDWLRHLYYEATRWLNSLTGQVKWREVTAKDPNNGSKMTVKDLEATLPIMLQDCLQNNFVPRVYVPEVQYFLRIAGQKIDNGVLSDLVQTRKRVLSLKDSLEMFCGLSGDDKIKVVSMVDIASLYTDVTNLVTRLQGMRIPTCEILAVQEDDRSSKFKLIDWLRHMYLVCQKWLNNEAGQMQWSKLNAQDPNNSKDGKRMKLDELKQSLKVLVPGLGNEIVPRPYMSEVAILSKVLCYNEGKFVNKILSAEEHLRKLALKLEDVFGNLGDPQAVLSAMDSAHLPWMLSVVLTLKIELEAAGEVDNIDAGEMMGAEPDLLEILEEPSYEMQVQEQVLQQVHEEAVQEQVLQQVQEEAVQGQVLQQVQEEAVQEEVVQEEVVQEGSSEPLHEDSIAESDGTEYLMDIIDQLSNQEDPTPDVHDDSMVSPPHEGSAPASPISQHRHSVDEQLSDDSGFYSPEPNNPLDLEDAFELPELEDFNLEDLDFSSLPDVVLTDDKPEFPTCYRKRRLSCESYEEPTIKRARP